MTSLRQLRVGADNALWCVQYARSLGVPVQVTSVLRSRAKQEQLYAAWRAGQSRWPAAKPGFSAHEYGLAWDSVVPSWAETWWKRLREWAGWQVPSGDTIHAQVPGWREMVGLTSP